MKEKSPGMIRAGVVLCLIPALIWACSKGGGSPSPGNNCSGVTIAVTLTASASDPCSASGGITASATGSSGFTFSLDGGAFQASGNFTNVSSGNHSITAKDNNGCTGSNTVNVTAAAAGPLFAAVKAVAQANCAVTGCHNGTQSPNFTVDCNIAANSALIKTRAVDQAGTASQMPQPPNPTLSQADRDKISNWVAAGGKFTN